MSEKFGELVACLEILPEKDERCLQPAEILDRQFLDSTDGPIMHISTVCVRGHRLLFPADTLADVEEPDLPEPKDWAA